MFLPIVALVYFVGSAMASTPGNRDHDGLPDRWEQRYGLSTTKNSAKGDPDRDGLRNRREYRLRTNPRKRDTDGDGYDDRVEVRAGTDPRDASNRPFPSPSLSGVPGGWTPSRTRTTDLVVTQPGAVVQDILLVNADLIVDAPNVTIRRVRLQGGRIDNRPGGSPCRNGMVVANSSIEPAPGQNHSTDEMPAFATGGYTARGVEIWRRTEGFRVGGKNSGGCGPVRIADSFVTVVDPGGGGHQDGLQAYDGPAFTIRNTTIDMREAPDGTAAFFAPANQGNTSAVVDRLLVMGAGIPFRHTIPGRVTGLKIVDKAWYWAPMDVDCSLLSHWDAKIVTIDPHYQVTSTVRNQPC